MSPTNSIEFLIEAPPKPAQTNTVDDESNKPDTLFPRLTVPSSSNLTHDNNNKALVVQGYLLFVVHTKSLPTHAFLTLVRCIGAKHKIIV